MKRMFFMFSLLFMLFAGIRISADSNFVKMANGDYSVLGTGSVTEELISYGIDTFGYQLGTKENKALMMAEGDRNIYLYIYDKTAYKNYDRVSISSYYGDAAKRPTLESNNLKWEEMNIELVSYDSTSKLQKYLIEDLSFLEDTYHSIYVREIYNCENRKDKSFIFSVGFIYQYNPVTRQSKIDTEEIIRVTDKKVAYEIYPQNQGTFDYIWQRNYVAFSTDKKMEDLIEVKLKYDGFDYSAYTDIELNMTSNGWDGKRMIQNFSQALTNKNVFKHVMKNKYFQKGKTYKDNEVSIKNKEINLNYSNGWWWGKTTGEWSYQTIEKTEVLREKKASLSDTSILNYDYVISFDNRQVDCFTFGTFHNKILWEEWKTIGGISVGVRSKNGGDFRYSITWNPFETPDFTKESITAQVIKDSVARTKNLMLEVEDLTLLEFHYMENGEVKHAIAVDTYTNTEGGSQFTDNSVTSAWDNFWGVIHSFFNNKMWNTTLKIIFWGIVIMIVLFLLYRLIFGKRRKKSKGER